MEYSRPNVGDRFSGLVVTSDQPRRISKSIRFPCRCDCGNITYFRLIDLREGAVKSCGCRQYTKSHNQSSTPIYNAWKTMKQRCHNPKDKDFKHYGGRGIVVCQRWHDDFSAFLADMGPRPTPLHTVERKNNDGNYEPSNCCWATRKEQNSNRKRAT